MRCLPNTKFASKFVLFYKHLTHDMAQKHEIIAFFIQTKIMIIAVCKFSDITDKTLCILRETSINCKSLISPNFPVCCFY